MSIKKKEKIYVWEKEKNCEYVNSPAL
jgi:hypothetical protein